jgi:hypothetical protein
VPLPDAVTVIVVDAPVPISSSGGCVTLGAVQPLGEIVTVTVALLLLLHEFVAWAR